MKLRSGVVSQFTLGLDFGTESVRAVLVDVVTGEIVSTKVHLYSDGVIDECLPGNGNSLPVDWALQNPVDWLDALQATVTAVLEESKVGSEMVVGIGIDFTACTILPCLANGKAFCTLEEYRDQPHAWAKLWKHHAAQPQADRVNELAFVRKEKWLARYGGAISPEWLIPKALQILDEAPELYSIADVIIEGADWIVWN